MGECSARMLLNLRIQHHAKEQGMGYDLNMIFDGAGLELPPRPAAAFSEASSSVGYSREIYALAPLACLAQESRSSSIRPIHQ